MWQEDGRGVHDRGLTRIIVKGSNMGEHGFILRGEDMCQNDLGE